MSFEEYRSRKIKIFRNGDIYSPAKKLLISAKLFRNYEQFLGQIARDVALTSGAVRKMYTIEGKLCKGLNDLVDGGIYVATSGEHFKNAPYMSQETNEVVLRNKSARRRAQASFGMLNSEINHIMDSKEKPIFGPSTKSFNVLVFVNGDTKDPLRLLLSFRNCKTFDQLLRYLSVVLRLATGHVRKVYDAITFQRLRLLQDLHDGQNLIACAHENVKKLNYEVVDLNFKSAVIHEVPRVITFFPNGDPYHTGLCLSVTKKKFKSIKMIIELLNTQIELYTGKIMKIYSQETGKNITKTEELESGKLYILVANNDPLINIRYNAKAITSLSHAGLGGSTLKNEFMARIRKATVKWPKPLEQTNSFTTRTDTPKKPKSALKRVISKSKAAEDNVKTVTLDPTAKPKSARTREPSEKADSVVPEDLHSSPEDNEEIYEEKETQFMASEAAKQSVVSPKSNVRSEIASPVTNPRSAIASPETNPRTNATSAKSNARSQIASPETNPRTNATSAKSNARSQVASPKEPARSEIASPAPKDEDSESEDDEPAVKSKRSSREELKSPEVKSRRGSKELKSPAVKSRRGSKDELKVSKSSKIASEEIEKSFKSEGENLDKSAPEISKSLREIKSPIAKSSGSGLNDSKAKKSKSSKDLKKSSKSISGGSKPEGIEEPGLPKSNADLKKSIARSNADGLEA